MKRSRWIYGWCAVVGAIVLAGCGAALTGVVGGALFATKGSGGKGGITPNSAAAAPTAVVSSNSGAGTVLLSVALTDAESDQVELVVRYSTDPNDSATTAFPFVATGTLTDSNGTSVTLTQVPTSPSGINYVFAWNTAQDLGAVKVDNVRLQVLLRTAGSSATLAVANTTSTFVIDNTKAPIIVSATLGALPGGASVYADDQQNRGFIPVTVVIADAESSLCSLKAVFSMDGGVTFPTQNSAAGLFVDVGNTVQPPDRLATSPGGTSYTFRFNSAASGLGVNGAQSIVLQFQAADSKSSAPRNATAPGSGSTSFGVNNASFSVVLSTPSGSQITDKVVVPYQLIDVASEGLDVQVLYALPGQPAQLATPVTQPPHTGSSGLTSSPGGTQQYFVWNAFFDMVVQRKLVTSAGIVVQLSATRPSTQVKKGPFPTSPFSVDHRLIESIFNKVSGVVDGVLGTAQPLSQPGPLARFGSNLYICDQGTKRVRALDLTTRKISTVVGGGASRLDGALGGDYSLGVPTGIAVSTAQGGTLFLTEETSDANNNPVARFIRVDGSTPVVTTFTTLQRGDRVMTLDQASDTVILELNSSGKRLVSFKADGTQGFQGIVGGGGGLPDDAGTPFALNTTGSNVQIGDQEPTGAVIDTTRLGSLIMVADRGRGRVLAVNFGANPINAYGKSIPARTVVTIAPGLAKPKGLALVDRTIPGVCAQDDIAVVEEQGQRVTLIPFAGGPAKILIGSATGVFGFAGEGQDPLQALMVFPQWIAPMGNVSNDVLAVADINNGRVRALEAPSTGLPNGSFITIAGSGFVTGDPNLAATSLMVVPNSVAPIGTNDILVADPILSRIRRIDRTNYRIDTIAGDGQFGNSGDGGQALAAQIGLPNCVATDPSGRFYVAQLSANIIRKVDTTGIITKVAGAGGPPGGNPNPDDGTAPALNVAFNQVSAMAVRGSMLAIAQIGSLVFVMNDGSAPITFGGISIPPGAVARVAGDVNATVAIPTNGTSARNNCLIAPQGITLGPGPNPDIFVGDSQWCAVYRIDATTGNLFLEAGQPPTRGYQDGPIGTALFDQISAIYLDNATNILYVSDSRNSRIRAINRNGVPVSVFGVTIPANSVGTVAGTDGKTFMGSPPRDVEEGGPALEADVSSTEGIGGTMFVDATGSLVFADGNTARVRRVGPNGFIYTVAGMNLVDDGEPLLGTPGRPAENAKLFVPSALVALRGGAYFVIDNGRIRLVDPNTTSVVRLGGVAQQQPFGDGGSLLDACFATARTPNQFADVVSDSMGPRAAAVSSGSTFSTTLLAIADTHDHKVRIANIGTAAFTHPALGTIPAGGIVRICGGAAGAGSDNVLATDGSVQLDTPQGVTFTSSGFLLVSDTNNDRIRAINLNSSAALFENVSVPPGFITTVAVVASSAVGNVVRPRALSYNELDRVLIVQNGDPGNLGVTPPEILGIYVGDPTISKFLYGRLYNVPGRSERIDFGNGSIFWQSAGVTDVPRGVAVDPVTRDVYFGVRESFGGFVQGMTGHTVSRIPVNVPFGASGSVQRVAGLSNSAGISGDGGLGTQAQLNSPTAVAVDDQGNVYILDARNFRVRRVRKFP